MEEDFGLAVTIGLDFDRAVLRTRVALKAKGFSILSEMRAPTSPGEDLGRKHLFLSIWQRLISTANLGGQGLDVGDHLACNVVVFEDEGATVIAVLDPGEGMEGWSEADLGSEATQAITEMLDEVASEA